MLIYFFCLFIYFFTLKYCIGFAIHQHESSRGVHMFPILNSPPTSFPVLLGHHSAPAPSILYPALNLDWQFISLYDFIHVSMPFSQIIPPSPSPIESKRLFYTSMSFLLSCIQGYCYHLSKFHIYALVYCISVFLSGLLHSV